MPRIDLIQVRRSTTAEWAAADPVLAVGEPGLDTDLNLFKLGDGTVTWSELPPVNGSYFRLFDVRAYGAVLDGSTADHAAINAAITAASAAGGGIVYAPPGSQIGVAGSIVMRSNVWLQLPYCTIQPTTATYTFTFIRNHRSTQSSGAVDTDMVICGPSLVIDGEATGVVDDGREGNGIGLYGCERVLIEGVRLNNIPFSGVEVAENYSGVVNDAVTSTSAPTVTTKDVTIRDVIGTHVGWQEPFLAGTPLAQWGDAGFGIIGRTGCVNLKVSDCSFYDVHNNGFGVGQMDSARDNTVPPTDFYVQGAWFARCLVDNTNVATTPGAPSFRAAFAIDVHFTDCTSLNNPTTSGFAVREASSVGTHVEHVTLTGCVSDGDGFGFIVNGDNEHAYCSGVTLNGCIARRTVNQAFELAGRWITATGCIAVDAGSHGFWVREPTGHATPFACYIELVGCKAINCGTGVGTHGGAILDDVSYCAITGGIFVGAEYGIREIGVSDFNRIAPAVCTGTTAAKSTVGASSVIGTHV